MNIHRRCPHFLRTSCTSCRNNPSRYSNSMYLYDPSCARACACTEGKVRAKRHTYTQGSHRDAQQYTLIMIRLCIRTLGRSIHARTSHTHPRCTNNRRRKCVPSSLGSAHMHSTNMFFRPFSEPAAGAEPGYKASNDIDIDEVHTHAQVQARLHTHR